MWFCSTGVRDWKAENSRNSECQSSSLQKDGEKHGENPPICILQDTDTDII